MSNFTVTGNDNEKMASYFWKLKETKDWLWPMGKGRKKNPFKNSNDTTKKSWRRLL